MILPPMKIVYKNQNYINHKPYTLFRDTMENLNYPKWKYIINIKKPLHAYQDGTLDWNTCIIQLYEQIQELKKQILPEDNDLLEEIESWENDVFVVDGTKISSLHDEDDVDEFDYELSNLYDIGDYKKMIWFSL